MAKIRTKAVCLSIASVAMTTPTYIALLAEPAHAAGCGIFASVPTSSSTYHEVRGKGGRSGCTSSRQIKLDLRWDRPFSPDPSLDYRSGTYTNVTLNVDATCLAGTHGYYDEVDGDAGHISSSKKSISATSC